VAEWLRSGLQIRPHRFDSGRRLQYLAGIGIPNTALLQGRLQRRSTPVLVANIPVRDLRAFAGCCAAAHRSIAALLLTGGKGGKIGRHAVRLALAECVPRVSWPSLPGASDLYHLRVIRSERLGRATS
jgi:hypothetical protein